MSQCLSLSITTSGALALLMIGEGQVKEGGGQVCGSLGIEILSRHVGVQCPCIKFLLVCRWITTSVALTTLLFRECWVGDGGQGWGDWAKQNLPCHFRNAKPPYFCCLLHAFTSRFPLPSQPSRRVGKMEGSVVGSGRGTSLVMGLLLCGAAG